MRNGEVRGQGKVERARAQVRSYLEGTGVAFELHVRPGAGRWQIGSCGCEIPDGPSYLRKPKACARHAHALGAA